MCRYQESSGRSSRMYLRWDSSWGKHQDRPISSRGNPSDHKLWNERLHESNGTKLSTVVQDSNIWQRYESDWHPPRWCKYHIGLWLSLQDLWAVKKDMPQLLAGQYLQIPSWQCLFRDMPSWQVWGPRLQMLAMWWWLQPVQRLSYILYWVQEPH
jgi:hypothetical protein